MRRAIRAGCVCIAAVLGQAHAQPIDYAPMQVVGKLTDRRIPESSGLAASIRSPGHLWTHNDSGDGPRLFLIETTGRVVAEYHLDLPPGEKAIDWEDMCSFTLDGKAYLLVADTGNSPPKREVVTLWLVEEPAMPPEADGRKADGRPSVGFGSDALRIEVAYADGPRDVESVAFDPTTRTVLLVSKEWPSPQTGAIGGAGVYRFTLPDESTATPLILEREAELTLKVVTAADVSPDGLRCVLLTYGDAYQYVREEDEPWPAAFERGPTPIALGPRGQSEAVCFGLDGVTLYLTAERTGRPIWSVPPVAAIPHTEPG